MLKFLKEKRRFIGKVLKWVGTGVRGKRIGEDKYVLMFDNYSLRPHNFGFVETTDFRTFTPIGHFDEEGSPMKRTNFSEQKHGAVIWITKKEAQRLEKRFQKS